MDEKLILVEYEGNYLVEGTSYQKATVRPIMNGYLVIFSGPEVGAEYRHVIYAQTQGEAETTRSSYHVASQD